MIKNVWSLNADELLVADTLKNLFNKTEYEVFFPLNSQMKDIDLLLTSLKSYKSKSIQIKGSRTYPPRKKEVERHGNGGAAWFTIPKKGIFNTHNRIDFFILVIHNSSDIKIKSSISINYLIIPIKKFQDICNKCTLNKKELFNFYIWIDSGKGRVFEFRNNKETINLAKYLNNWNLLK